MSIPPFPGTAIWKSIGVSGGGDVQVIALSGDGTKMMAFSDTQGGYFTTTAWPGCNNLGDQWSVANGGQIHVAGSAIIQSTTEANTWYALTGTASTGGTSSGGGVIAFKESTGLWSLRSTAIMAAGNHNGAPLPSGGQGWRNTGHLLVMEPTASSGNTYLWGGGYGQGIQRSACTGTTSDATTWVAATTGLTGNVVVRAIAMDTTTNPPTIYASLINVASGTSFSWAGIYSCAASHAPTPAFTILPHQPSGTNVHDLWVMGGFLYAAMGPAGLARLNISTGAWTTINGGFIDTTTGSTWTALTGYIDNNGKHQLLLCNSTAQADNPAPSHNGPGIFISDAAGASPGYADPQATQHANTPLPNNGSRSYWHQTYHNWFGGGAFFTPNAAVDASNPASPNWYVTGSNGFCRSIGGNNNWTIAGNGQDCFISHDVWASKAHAGYGGQGDADFGWIGWSTKNGFPGYDASVTYTDNPPGGGEPFSIFGDYFDDEIHVGVGTKYSVTGTSGGTGGAVGHRPYNQPTDTAWVNLNIPVGGSVAVGLCVARAAPYDGTGAKVVIAAVSTKGIWRWTSAGGWNEVDGANGEGSWGPKGTIGSNGNAPLAWQPGTGDMACFNQSTGKLFFSVDTGTGPGQLWYLLSTKAGTGPGQNIAFHPTRRGEIWWSTDSGLFWITNAHLGAVGSGATLHGPVAAVPNNGPVAYAPAGVIQTLPVLVCVQNNTPASGSGVLFSTDDGASWSDGNTDKSFTSINCNPTGIDIDWQTGVIYVSGSNIVAFGTLGPGGPTQGTASLAGAGSLTANWKVTGGGGAIQGFANLAGAGQLTSNPAGVVSLTMTMAAMATFTAPIPQGGFTIIQQISGSATFDYGAASIEMTTSEGNAIIVLAGWDLSTSPTSAAMPALYVTDSAGNYYNHAGTSNSNVSGSRCAAWVSLNAEPISWISASLTTFASSLAFTILEVAGMPQNFFMDIVDIQNNGFGTSLSLLPGSTTDLDFAFALFSIGGFATTVTNSNSLWNSLNSVTAGFGPSDLNPVTIFPYYCTPAGGNSLNTTFTVPQNLALSGLVFSIHTNTAPPLQINPNLPALKVEAGFGFTPGDPSQSPPTWTDITNRCVGDQGQAFIEISMGRQYELAVAEAGQIQIGIDNHDGAFTPGNAISPYYPNVVLGTPIRISAFWQGNWFYLGFGYVERWPQEWPDLPQWGISRMVATDAIAVLAAVTMQSAMDSEALLDAPYVLIPAFEQYTNFSNGINGFFSFATTSGLLAQNISRQNQRAGVYAPGAFTSLNSVTNLNSTTIINANTGTTTNLLGSSNSGFGTTAITAAPTVSSSGPGMIYTDPSLPGPLSANGVTVNFWVIVPIQAAGSAFTTIQPTIFSAYGPISNYGTGIASLTVQLLNFPGNNTMVVTLADGSTISAPFNSGNNSQMITLTITASSMSIYLNGALESTTSLTSTQVTAWNAVSLGCPNYAYQASGNVPGNFTAFSLSIYNYQLPVQRIVSQFNTGNLGQSGVDAVTRVAQILCWANLGLPRGGRTTFSGAGEGILQGPAYNLSGATAADAVNQIAVNENTMVAAMANGAIVYTHKWATFNKAPAATFGDNPAPAAGELPSLQTTSWGYDNTYVYNIDQITQQFGANNLFTVTAADFNSQHAYFTRSALSETLMTAGLGANLDIYTQANWQLAKYSQPSLRLSQLTVDAASNPSHAFSVILPLQQGDVVTVARRPIGGAIIIQQAIVQKITHSIGPGKWETTYQLTPYAPENAVLALDNPGYNEVGFGTLP